MPCCQSARNRTLAFANFPRVCSATDCGERGFRRNISIAVPAPEFGLAATTDSENAMSTLSFAPAQKAKISLHPSGQAIRRAALALAIAFALAGAAVFGHYYLTTGRYLETTDDAYVKADSTIVA